MRITRLAAAAAGIISVSAVATAQETPPLGAWLEAGDYCARGVRAVVPDGYEAISFGNGVEIRRVGGGASLLELNSFPSSGGMPPFESFLDRLQLPCKEGFQSQSTIAERDADGLSALDVLVRRCVGPSTSYGLYFSRAELTTGGGPHDASVMALFGDEPFQIGRVSFTEAQFIPEETAAALFETMTTGLAACAIEAPPAPPPPPEPTGWLGAGPHCAFTIGGTVPDGFEFRFNGLASNGGSIDLRLEAIEGGYHRSEIFVWPLRGAALEPPEASRRFDGCPEGFETTRRREAFPGEDSETIHVLVEGCFSAADQYYGSLFAHRRLALPSGDHWVRGAFSIGSPDLPRRLGWTEFKSLTEAEVRSVVDGFIGSMGACDG